MFLAFHKALKKLKVNPLPLIIAVTQIGREEANEIPQSIPSSFWQAIMSKDQEDRPLQVGLVWAFLQLTGSSGSISL